MNSFLLNRQLGSIAPGHLAAAQNDRLLKSLQFAPNVAFSLKAQAGHDGEQAARAAIQPRAHAAGVSSITVDPFEGK